MYAITSKNYRQKEAFFTPKLAACTVLYQTTVLLIYIRIKWLFFSGCGPDYGVHKKVTQSDTIGIIVRHSSFQILKT